MPWQHVFGTIQFAVLLGVCEPKVRHVVIFLKMAYTNPFPGRDAGVTSLAAPSSIASPKPEKAETRFNG